MAQTKGNKGKSGKKGFGSMNENKKRELASQGGRASAQSDTSNRGFASMDKNKQREISSQGGKASQGSSPGKSTRATTRNEDAENRYGVSGDLDMSERDLNSLEEEDEMASSRKEKASYSETDEDEDEGLGDGNIGRAKQSRGSDEEG
jgi:uncharacterized protein